MIKVLIQDRPGFLAIELRDYSDSNLGLAAATYRLAAAIEEAADEGCFDFWVENVNRKGTMELYYAHSDREMADGSDAEALQIAMDACVEQGIRPL